MHRRECKAAAIGAPLDESQAKLERLVTSIVDDYFPQSVDAKLQVFAEMIAEVAAQGPASRPAFEHVGGYMAMTFLRMFYPDDALMFTKLRGFIDPLVKHGRTRDVRRGVLTWYKDSGGDRPMGEMMPSLRDALTTGLRYATHAGLDPLADEYDEPREITPLFDGSRRPLTHMYTLGADVRDRTPPANALPVVRYEPVDDDKCYTDYTYEPDSRCYLEMGRTMRAPNRLGAIVQLADPSQLDASLNDVLSKQLLTALLYDVAQQGPYRVLKGMPSEWHAWESNKDERVAQATLQIGDGLKHWLRTGDDSKLPSAFRSMAAPGEHRYWAKFTDPVNGMPYWIDHAYRDAYGRYVGWLFAGRWRLLDFHLCQLAANKGYDTVVLQSEPGYHHAETLVMDVRSGGTSSLSRAEKTYTPNRDRILYTSE